MLVLSGRNASLDFYQYPNAGARKCRTGITRNKTWTVWFWFNAFTGAPCAFDPNEETPVKRNLFREHGNGTNNDLRVFQEATGSGTWKLIVQRGTSTLMAEMTGLLTNRWYGFAIRCDGEDIHIQSFQHDASPDTVNVVSAGAAYNHDNNSASLRLGTDTTNADARGLLAYFGLVDFFLPEGELNRMRLRGAPNLAEMLDVCASTLQGFMQPFNSGTPDTFTSFSRDESLNHINRPAVFVDNNTTDGGGVFTPGTGAAWFGVRPKDFRGWDELDASILTGIPGVAEVWINDELPTHDDPMVGLVNGTELFWPCYVEKQISTTWGQRYVVNSQEPQGLDTDMLKAIYEVQPGAFPFAATIDDVFYRMGPLTGDARRVRGVFKVGENPAYGFQTNGLMMLRTAGPCPAYLQPWTGDHTMIFIYQFNHDNSSFSMGMGVWDEWVRHGYGALPEFGEGYDYLNPPPDWNWEGPTLIDLGYGRCAWVGAGEGEADYRVRAHYSSHGGGGSVGPNGPKVPTWLFSQQSGGSGNTEKNRKICVAVSVYRKADNTVTTFADGRAVEIGNPANQFSNPYKIPGDDLYNAFASPFRLFGNLAWGPTSIGNEENPGPGNTFRGTAFAEAFVRRAMSPAEIKALTDDITQFSGAGGLRGLEDFSDVDTFRKIQTA